MAPRTSALFGVGTDVAAQLLTTAGDNPDRLRYDARTRAYATRCTTEGQFGKDILRCLKRTSPAGLHRLVRRLHCTDHLTSIGASERATYPIVASWDA
jgi:hypothetical protein